MAPPQSERASANQVHMAVLFLRHRRAKERAPISHALTAQSGINCLLDRRIKLLSEPNWKLGATTALIKTASDFPVFPLEAIQSNNSF